MADEPSNNPAPEELKPQSDMSSSASDTPAANAAPSAPSRPVRRGAYRPSHRATFIGLIVVVLILAINAGVLAFVLKSQSKANNQAAQGQVTINQSALDKLGVNRTTIGNSGIQLTVNPDAQFKGNVQVGGDVTVGGELKINGKFSAQDASFTQLEAGKTSFSNLNVNGDGTLTNLALRSNLTVSGSSNLQGATFSKLVSINSGLTVTGNLSVGGTLAVGNFSASNLTVSGHLISSGGRTSVSRGVAVGTLGTVSISGTDSAGTIAANTDTSPTSGLVATVAFSSSYGSTPNVVITPINGYAEFYVTRTTAGFSIYSASALTPSRSYGISYIVEQ